MEKKFSIEIYGEQYPIKGDLNPDYMMMLAKEVDNRMHELAQKNQHLPPQKISTLVALYFADDYFKLKKEYDSLLNLINDVGNNS